MSDVFYIRPIAPPLTPEDVLRMSVESGGCFDLHRVAWACSFLATDGGRMLCWFRAPDAESARMALRQLKSDMRGVWPGTPVPVGDSSAGELPRGNLLAEIRFDTPLSGGASEAAERLGHRMLRDSVSLGFLSNDGSRMACVLHAPDAGVVRPALAAAALPASSIWPCTVVSPPGRDIL